MKAIYKGHGSDAASLAKNNLTAKWHLVLGKTDMRDRVDFPKIDTV